MTRVQTWVLTGLAATSLVSGAALAQTTTPELALPKNPSVNAPVDPAVTPTPPEPSGAPVTAESIEDQKDRAAAYQEQQPPGPVDPGHLIDKGQCGDARKAALAEGNIGQAVRAVALCNPK
jgi:hypothetical protein